MDIAVDGRSGVAVATNAIIVNARVKLFAISVVTADVGDKSIIGSAILEFDFWS